MNIKGYMIILLTLTTLKVVYCSSEQTEVGVIPYEDLNDCKLQHGIQELPEAGSPKARKLNGQIFNFKTQKLNFNPLMEKQIHPDTYEQFRDAIIKEKTGDTYFKSVETPALIALSGRIKNLGQHHLYEYNNVKMSVPEEVYYTEDGETAPGILTNVKLGECFLMTTLEGELVLLRLIAIDEDKRCCTIQWVKANSGSNIFNIPKRQLIQPIAEISASNDSQLKTADSNTPQNYQLEQIRQLIKEANTYMNNRQSLIKDCLAKINKIQYPYGKGGSYRVPDDVIVAIRLLVDIRAEEVSTVLAQNIDIYFSLSKDNGSGEVGIDNTWGCVPALVLFGKAGTTACLKEIVNLTQEDWEKPYKSKLLLIVIIRVEGEEFTRQILGDFKESLTDESQIENIEKAIALIDEAISYDGPKEDIYSKLKEELIKESEKKQENEN